MRFAATSIIQAVVLDPDLDRRVVSSVQVLVSSAQVYPGWASRLERRPMTPDPHGDFSPRRTVPSGSSTGSNDTVPKEWVDTLSNALLGDQRDVWMVCDLLYNAMYK